MHKTTYTEKLQKGKEYEDFISRHYRDCGYVVYENGLNNGRKDGGIDLVAVKEKDIVFIQCRNWSESSKYKVRHTEIKVFETNVNNYLEKNPIFKTETYTKKLRYIISGDFIHQSAIKYIKEKENIDFEIIRIK